MVQTLSNLLIHCVFHKKASAPAIRDEEQKRLNLFIEQTARHYQCSCLIANGTGNHLHLLVVLSVELPLAQFVKEIKRLSTRFLKECDAGYYHSFYWQAGYAAFSVSEKYKDAVYGYIARQKEHHRCCSPQREFELLLRNAGIENAASACDWEEK